MGNMNVNFLDNSCPKARQLKTWARLSSMSQLIDKPTRSTHNNTSCLDLIFTDSPDIAAHGIVNLNISDHDLVYITKKKTSKPKSKISFMGRSYKDFDENVFCELLLNKDWTAVSVRFIGV